MMGIEAEKERLLQGRISQLLEMPYREAATELLRGRLEELRKPEKVDEWETLPADEYGRIFREHKTTGKRELVAGAPPRGPAPTRGVVVTGVDPTTKTPGIFLLDPVTGEKKSTGLVPPETDDETAINIPYWINGRKGSVRVKGEDYNTTIRLLKETGAELEKPPGREELFEDRDTLMSFTHEPLKEGGKPKAIGEEDAAGIAAFDRDLREKGRRVVGLALPDVSRDLAVSLGWPIGGKWDVTFRDLPARNIYMIAEEGEIPTEERIIEELVSTYFIPEDQARLYYDAWRRGK